MAHRRKASIGFNSVGPGKFPENMIFVLCQQTVLNLNDYYPANATSAIGNAAVGLTHGNVNIIPVSGTLKNLYIGLDVNAGATPNVVTVYVNGVASALTASIATGTAVAHDTTHAVAVSAGDTISLKFTGAADGGNTQVSLEFAPNS